MAVGQAVLNDLKVNEKFTVSIGVAEMSAEDYADLLIARTQAALTRATTEGGGQTSRLSPLTKMLPYPGFLPTNSKILVML